MTLTDPDRKNQKQRIINLTLAAVAGQVGCLTLVIVLGAVLIGLWLDQYYGTRPMITLILVIASVPVSVVVMYYVARAAIRKIKVQSKQEKPEDR